MSIKNKDNSLWNRIMNESNFDEEFDNRGQSSDFENIPSKRNNHKRNDRILSSDEYVIGDESIEYRPKKYSRRDDDNFTNKKNKYQKRDYNNFEDKYHRNNSNNKSDRNNKDKYNRKDFHKLDRSDNRDYNKSDRFDNRDYNRSERFDSRDYNRSDRFDNRDYNRSDRFYGEEFDKSDRYNRKNSKNVDRRKKSNYKNDNQSFEDRFDYSRNKGKGRNSNNQNKGKKSNSDDLIRLNKFIADAGVCSRRDADKLIEAGCVTVNGKIVNVLGSKVKRTDKVQVEGQTLNHEKLKYLLLNKPKGYITTVEDERKRNTVMQLVDGACKERIYPVGRLDRNTSGLLLFTNDGDLANKLMHPSSEIIKVYHVVLDKNVSWDDIQKISEGFELDDGFIKVDSIDYVSGKSKNEVGVKIHSGRNRIVRRIFEHLGYDVIKLDRTLYAGLTKKDLPRGKWRFLTNEEINYLKML